MNQSNSDRVTISIGRKIPAEQYGSVELFISYSMDKDNELSREEIVARCRKTVLAEMNRLIDLVEHGKVNRTEIK